MSPNYTPEQLKAMVLFQTFNAMAAGEMFKQQAAASSMLARELETTQAKVQDLEQKAAFAAAPDAGDAQPGALPPIDGA